VSISPFGLARLVSAASVLRRSYSVVNDILFYSAFSSAGDGANANTNASTSSNSDSWY